MSAANDPRARLLAIGAITITSVLWGTTGTAATYIPDASPLAIGAAALGVGGLLQGIVGIGSIVRARTLLRARMNLVLLGAVAVVVYPLAFYSSMRLAGVAIGTVVSLASAPLASGVLERFTRGVRLSPWWIASATVGVVGSALICVSTATGASGDAARTLGGIGLGLVAGTAYALYSTVAHRLMRERVPRASAMGAVFGLGGLLLMPVLLVTGRPLLDGAVPFAATAYMGLVPMFVGYLLFGYGLARVGASTATTITLSEPAVAALLAVVVVGERLSPIGWVGLALIGVVLVLLTVAPAQTGEPEDHMTKAPATSRREDDRRLAA